MKKILIIAIGLILGTPTFCWSQGKVSRPPKKELGTTNKTGKSNVIPQKRITEIINGFMVEWAPEITENQKRHIRFILNNMVYVEGGVFLMGSTAENSNGNDKPAHYENIVDFYINKYEMTYKIYQDLGGKLLFGYSNNRDNLPVEASWVNANKFINNLNYLTNLKFKLPSEAEWEYAAKGGKYSRGYKFSGSNDPEEVGWISSNSNGVKAVGLKKSNELGLFDMTGNMSEWTSDQWSENYNTTKIDNKYVSRGGGYYSDSNHSIVTHRNGNDPDTYNVSISFRLALQI